MSSPAPQVPRWLENPLLRGLMIVASVATCILLIGLGVWAGRLAVRTSGSSRAAIAVLWAAAISAPALLAWSAKRSQSRLAGVVGLLTLPILFGVVAPLAIGLVTSWPWARAQRFGGLLFVALAFVSWGIQLVAASSTLAAKPGERLTTVRDHALVAVMHHAGLVSAVMVTLPTILWIATAAPRTPLPLLGVVAAVVGVAGSYGGATVTTTLLRSFGRAVPADLARTIEHAQALCGTRFAGVIFLDEVIAAVPVCMVTIDWRGCILVSNSRAWRGLDDAARLAVIVHEIAHVIHGHLARGALVGVVTGCAAFAASVALSGLLGVRGPLVVVIAPVVAIGAAIARAAMQRRWERQADVFAARVAGAEPLIAALGRLTPPGTPDSLLSTHDPLARRALLARESAGQAPSQD